MGPLRSLLPNPGLLHKVVGEALTQAYEQARAADGEVGPWLSQLHDLPISTPD